MTLRRASERDAIGGNLLIALSGLLRLSRGAELELLGLEGRWLLATFERFVAFEGLAVGVMVPSGGRRSTRGNSSSYFHHCRSCW